MGVWHFVRHGESVANAGRWLAGHVDAPLTDRGREQARAAAARIGALPLGRVLTSDLCRATETADALLGGWHGPREARAELRERNLGAWERVSRDALEDGAPELMRWDLGPPGGEAPCQVALRYCTVFAALDDIDQDTLVVAHGLALKAIVGLLDDVPPDRIPYLAYGNVQHETRQVDQARWVALRDRLLTEVPPR